MKYYQLFLFITLFISYSCKKEKPKEPIATAYENNLVKVAEGFSIVAKNNYHELKVFHNKDQFKKTYNYAIVPRKNKSTVDLTSKNYDAIIYTPVTNVIVTSTTHIPSLSALDEIDKIKGFPNTRYVSTAEARKRIDAGLIKEIGINETINTEVVLAIKPDVFIGFGVNSENNSYSVLEKVESPLFTTQIG